MSNLYEIIGKYIEKDNSRYFNELIGKIGYSEPVLYELQKLPEIKQLFCELQDISPERLTTKKHDRKAAWERELCIAVCYRLFSPNTFNPEIRQTSSKELNAALSASLNISPTKISEKFQNALFSYCNCRTFREITDSLCHKISTALDKAGHSLPEKQTGKPNGTLCSSSHTARQSAIHQ